MTPGTTEISLNQLFSDFITYQKSEKSDPFDLRHDNPVINPLHPKMLKALLSFMLGPQQYVPSSLIIPGKFYACFSNVPEAQKHFPELSIVRGLPSGVFKHRFDPIVLFDFSPFGAAIISTIPLDNVGSPGLHQHILPPLLEYVTSQEVWGAQGKWTRFHERLHSQFYKLGLLNGPSAPGLYPLIPNKAYKLEKRGIKGTHLGNSLVLTFPWTFPLSALERLEAIIQEEF
jgi:hypothetical protein